MSEKRPDRMEKFKPLLVGHVEKEFRVFNLDEYQTMAETFCRGHDTVTEALCCETLGLNGEAGEVADYLKKHIGHSQPLDVSRISKELGDVLWYVAKIATTCGLDLSYVASLNIKKLSERHPTGKFDPSYHATGLTEEEREVSVPQGYYEGPGKHPSEPYID